MLERTVPEPITISEYNPDWPVMFARESERIRAALEQRLVGIEHIGSTAVSGLAAKPIIDILAGVPDMRWADECVFRLEAIGYTYFPFPQFPERRFLADGSIGSARHHVHLTTLGSGFWEEKLLFRDWLRASEANAARYLVLKKRLAAEFGQDRERYEEYTDGKSGFILSALHEARHLPRE
jgi:GrpB-like predicted nucleotidyltransferase (UPF0157 family)